MPRYRILMSVMMAETYETCIEVPHSTTMQEVEDHIEAIWLHGPEAQLPNGIKVLIEVQHIDGEATDGPMLLTMDEEECDDH